MDNLEYCNIEAKKKQLSLNPTFLKVINDAFDKMTLKRVVYTKHGFDGDIWLTTDNRNLEKLLLHHVNIPFYSKPRIEYDDLLDIINYCLFLGYKEKIKKGDNNKD